MTKKDLVIIAKSILGQLFLKEIQIFQVVDQQTITNKYGKNRYFTSQHDTIASNDNAKKHPAYNI